MNRCRAAMNFVIEPLCLGLLLLCTVAGVAATAMSARNLDMLVVFFGLMVLLVLILLTLTVAGSVVRWKEIRIEGCRLRAALAPSDERAAQFHAFGCRAEFCREGISLTRGEGPAVFIPYSQAEARIATGNRLMHANVYAVIRGSAPDSEFLLLVSGALLSALETAEITIQNRELLGEIQSCPQRAASRILRRGRLRRVAARR